MIVISGVSPSGVKPGNVIIIVGVRRIKAKNTVTSILFSKRFEKYQICYILFSVNG